MAYDIEGIVNPEEIVNLKKLNTEINESTASLIKFLEQQAKMKSTVDETSKSNDTASQKISEYTKMINWAADSQNKLTAYAREHENIQKQIVNTEAKIFASKSESNKQLIANRLEIQKTNAATKDEIILNDKNSGTLEKLAAQNRILESEKKKLNLTTDQGKERLKEINLEQDKNNKIIQESSNQLQKQKINVGNYRNSLEGLFVQFKNGEIGMKGLASGVAQVGKQLLIAFVTNPILLAITAIVGAVVGLIKIFKSTDEGATAFAGVMKAIKNVIDVVVDRLVSFSKLLWSVVTFDFKGIKENAKDAFGGVGDALRDAAKAGWEYEQQMDRIQDTEFASLTRAARLKKEIEELNVASKNRNLGTAEQIRLAELAMQKSKELNELEVGFSKQKTEAEKNNLASLIEGDNLTIESKQKLLDEWLKIDDLQLQSELEKNEQFANFYNKNEEDFQNLQKLRAEDINKETSLITETRRLQTSLFAFKKELYDEDTRAKEEAIKRQQSIEKDASDLIQKQQEQDLKKYEDIIDYQIEQDNKRAENEIDASLKAGEQVIKDRQLLIESAIRDRQRQYEAEKLLIESTAKNEKDARFKIFELNKRYIDEDIAALQTQLENSDLSTEQRINLSNQLKDLELENLQSVADKDKQLHDEKLQRQKELADGLIQLGSKIFEFTIANTNAELSALEEKNKKGIISEQEFNKQKAELELKKAKQERNKALFEIAINTASAIVEALPNVALAAIAGIIGAISAATVLAEPLPKYWVGTKNAKEVGIAGDRGRELATLTTGENIMFDKPTLFAGKKFKGMHIRTNAETERIMAATEHKGFGAVSFSDSKIVEKLDSVEKAIKNKKEWILDDDYRVIGDQTESQRNIYINRLKYGR